MKPIYEPKGKAKEYGDYAINIYTGCPHRCYYCFAPSVLHRDRELFHTCIEPRKNIVEEVKKQLDREGITGKLIHLCFTCDPTGCDSTATREIIKLLKASGNHVQILTKGDGTRDFDLLDSEDWYGITLDGGADNGHSRSSIMRTSDLCYAHDKGIKTWVSFEPVLHNGNVLLELGRLAPCLDKVKVGKLNYYHSDINWKNFGFTFERICQRLGVDYYIKESLREEMNK